MSTSSALGASRVGRVMTELAAFGYRCARVSASGQRRGARRYENTLAGDLVALTPNYGHPHLIVEVGGIGKRLGVAFTELRELLMPGFQPLVVRYVKRKRWIYVDEDHRFDDFRDALDALRDA